MARKKIRNITMKYNVYLHQILTVFKMFFQSGNLLLLSIVLLISLRIFEMSVASMITVFLFFVLCLSDILRLNKAASSSLSSTTSPFSSLRTLHKTNHENQSEENQRYKQQKPNIIIIIADDLGWNDVSFHGSDQIPTPNIDALAYNGVILNSHYVLPLCTPSRAALLTGKHPIHLGMQHSVILPSEPRGLPLKEKLLPEYLKEAGYVTHAVGKWHLGFYKRVYTPTYRGFDSFFGYYNGYQDYYGHLVKNVGNNNKDFIGFDMRRNLSVAWDTIDKYSTDLFTEEAVQLINTHNTKNPMFLYMAHLATHSANLDNLLQAPDEEIAKFGYIRDPERRTYAAMVSKLDQSVGEIITALRNRGMLENSIVLFISDNGAPSTDMFNNHGSNYPLRGIKNSLWEGGTHGVAAIWSPLIKQPKRVSNQLMHVTDWLPTLFSAANLDKALLNSIDGIDVWQTISNNQVSPRTEMLINIDDISNNSAIRRDDFKYLIGDVKFDSWWGENGKPSVDFGFPPPYDPSKVLQSKAGIAIAGMTTSQQIMELRKKRDKSERDHEECCEIKMLTLEEIYSLRGEAEVLCNVTKEEMIPCQPRLSPCLFNIVKDPCEMINLADSKPGVLTMLKQALLQYRLTMISSSNVDVSELSNPSRYNNTWISWEDIQQMDTFDNEKEIKPPQEFSNSTIIIASILGGLLIVGMITLIASLYQKYTSKKMKRDLNVKVNSTEVTDPIIVNH